MDAPGITYSIDTALPRASIGDHVSQPGDGVAEKLPHRSLVAPSYNIHVGDEDPTEEELHGPGALRRVSAPIPWPVYTVAFVELCERFS